MDANEVLMRLDDEERARRTCWPPHITKVVVHFYRNALLESCLTWERFSVQHPLRVMDVWSRVERWCQQDVEFASATTCGHVLTCLVYLERDDDDPYIELGTSPTLLRPPRFHFSEPVDDDPVEEE
jgi:hypothetical protein